MMTCVSICVRLQAPGPARVALIYRAAEHMEQGLLGLQSPWIRVSSEQQQLKLDCNSKSHQAAQKKVEEVKVSQTPAPSTWFCFISEQYFTRKNSLNGRNSISPM